MQTIQSFATFYNYFYDTKCIKELKIGLFEDDPISFKDIKVWINLLIILQNKKAFMNIMLLLSSFQTKIIPF